MYCIGVLNNAFIAAIFFNEGLNLHLLGFRQSLKRLLQPLKSHQPLLSLTFNLVEELTQTVMQSVSTTKSIFLEGNSNFPGVSVNP